jgi:hypothetical protein
VAGISLTQHITSVDILQKSADYKYKQQDFRLDTNGKNT